MRSRLAQGGEIIFLKLGFSWSWSGEMRKTKKDTNTRKQTKAAGKRKQTNESAAKQVCVVNCAWMILQWASMSPTISRYRLVRRVSPFLLLLSSSPIITAPFFALNLTFFPAWYDSYSFIRVANFRFFTHWGILIRSSLFSLFRIGPCFLRGLCLLIT